MAFEGDGNAVAGGNRLPRSPDGTINLRWHPIMFAGPAIEALVIGAATLWLNLQPWATADFLKRVTLVAPLVLIMLWSFAKGGARRWVTIGAIVFGIWQLSQGAEMDHALVFVGLGMAVGTAIRFLAKYARYARHRNIVDPEHMLLIIVRRIIVSKRRSFELPQIGEVETDYGRGLGGKIAEWIGYATVTIELENNEPIVLPNLAQPEAAAKLLRHHGIADELRDRGQAEDVAGMAAATQRMEVNSGEQLARMAGYRSERHMQDVQIILDFYERRGKDEDWLDAREDELKRSRGYTGRLLAGLRAQKFVT